MILWIFMFMMLVGCTQVPSKPTTYQCVKMWNKHEQRAVYDCVPVEQSTLDGPR